MGNIEMQDIEKGVRHPLLDPQNNPPPNNQIPKGGKDLLNAVIENKIEEIESFFQNFTSEILLLVLQEKFEDYNGKCVLLIACDEDQVNTETLSKLCASIKFELGEIECIDECRYGWEAIHYVAKNANPEKLEILLDHLNISQMNSLTYFSENALHILLQYEKSVTSFNVDLFSDTDSRACTVIGEENDNALECAKLLIDKGIDINHANFWNETPICLAIKYRFSRIWKELLENSYIDVDNYFISGQSIRDYLKLNNLALSVIPSQSSVIEETVTTLFNFLKSGDEEGFIRHANEAKSVEVNEGDGSGTMLQFCLRRGFLEYVQDECFSRDYKECDIRNSPMLKIFYRKGYSRCIDYLLANGADPTQTSEKFKTPLLEYAARRGYYPYVAILLYHKDSKVGTDQIFEVLKNLLKENHSDNELKNTANFSFYRKCVLYLLLNKLIATFDRVKEHLTYDKLTTLNKTMNNLDVESADDSIDSELACQLLHLGSSLTGTIGGMNSASAGNEKTEDKMVVDLLDINTLRGHLDDCVENNSFICSSIIEDYNNVYSETVTISFLANDKIKKELLVHPLFIHFINKKWSRIAWVFYLDLFSYFMFLSSICVYMICLHTSLTTIYCTTIFLVLLGVHVIKEAGQLLFLYHWKYFKDSSNHLELVVIISCLVTFIYPNIYSMIVAILFATVIFFIMLGQLPIFAKYTIIFGSAKYFLEYTGFYFMQFLSFSICFYIIFPFKSTEQTDPSAKINSTDVGQKNSTDVGQLTGDLFKSLFYTLVHFTGEFSDRVLEPTDYPVFGRVIMTLFIFCMTIILNNLLVGLIVADMDDIQKSGRLYKQVKIATFIQTTDTFIKRIYDWKWMDCIKNIIKRIQLFKKNQNKNLRLNDDEAYYIFDDENKEYLKNLKTNKQNIFDRNMLRECYELIKKNGVKLSKIKNKS